MVAQNSATLPASFGKSGTGSSPTGPSGSGVIASDTITEFTVNNGVTIDKLLTCSAGLTSTAGTTTLGATVATTLAPTGAITPTGGIAPQTGTMSTCFHSGQAPPVAVTSNTDKTATNTETYIVEIFIPCNTTLTGVAIIGTASSTGNVQISLADNAGTVIAAAQSVSTAATAAAAYQQVPFATPYAAKGPAKYFVLLQNSGANHFEAHTIGNFGASKKTSETFGTFTNVTPPTTFTTALGPVCSTY